MNEIFDLADKLAGELLSNGKLLTAALLMVLGWALKAWPRFPNRFIPLVCICAGGAFFVPIGLMTGECAKVSFTISVPFVALAVRGMVLGVAVWLMHDKVLRHFEGVIPGLSDLLQRAETPAPDPKKTNP